LVGRLFVPPIFRVAPLLTVSVPPAAVRLAVNAPRSSTPELTVRLLFTAEFTPRVSVPLGLFTTRLLNVGEFGPLMLCAPAPVKLKVPVPELNVPGNAISLPGVGPNAKLPPMFVVLSFALNVPPLMVTLVGEITLPGLFVQFPPPPIRTSPPSVTFVPWTVTLNVVPIVLPPFTAVLPVNVTPGALVPSSVRPPPPT
jgi:hypothetical protein